MAELTPIPPAETNEMLDQPLENPRRFNRLIRIGAVLASTAIAAVAVSSFVAWTKSQSREDYSPVRHYEPTIELDEEVDIDDLTIFNQNIQHGYNLADQRNIEAILELTAQQQPDIVTYQEALFMDVPLMQRRFPYMDIFFDGTDYFTNSTVQLPLESGDLSLFNDRHKLSGNVVMVSDALDVEEFNVFTKKVDDFGSGEDRSIMYVGMELEGEDDEEVEVVVSHIAPTADVRNQQAKIINDFVTVYHDPEATMFYASDMNETIESKTMRIALEKTDLEPIDCGGGTYNGSSKQIDHVVVDDDDLVKRCAILFTNNSDHHALVVTTEPPEPIVLYRGGLRAA